MKKKLKQVNGSLHAKRTDMMLDVLIDKISD